MKHSRLKKKAGGPHDDISFLAPYSEQAKYLLLADKFVTNGSRYNVISIDGGKNVQRGKKAKKAA